MSASERRKGVLGEQEVARIFRAVGFDCERVPNSGGLRIKGDLAGSVPAHVEVKRQETLRLPTWLRQARDEAPPGVVPVVAFRQSRGDWYAALPLTHLADLLATVDLITLEVEQARKGRRMIRHLCNGCGEETPREELTPVEATWPRGGGPAGLAKRAASSADLCAACVDFVERFLSDGPSGRSEAT